MGLIRPGNGYLAELVAAVGIVGILFALVGGGINAAQKRGKENIFIAFGKGFLTSIIGDLFPVYDIYAQAEGDPFTGDKPSNVGLAFAFLGVVLPGSGSSYRKIIEGTEQVATHPNGIPKILRKYVSKKRLQEIKETRRISSSGPKGTFGNKVYLSDILDNHTTKDDIVALNELPRRWNANSYIDIDTTGMEHLIKTDKNKSGGIEYFIDAPYIELDEAMVLGTGVYK